MSSYIDYLDSISPRWLNKPNGKKFKKAFGQESDLLSQDLITAVNLGRLDLCDESALELHRRNSNLLQSPLESPEQLRTYLKKRWETWSLSGSKLSITNDLKRIGYPNTRVIDWYDLIKLGVSGPTAPFGGTYKKIAGASVNGDIYYLARVQKNDYSLIEVKHIAAPSQMFSLQLNAEVIEIRLDCDIFGNVVSKAKDVVNAINNNSIISKLLFARYSGTGNDVVGLGPGSGVEFEVSFPFWSFFYVTLDAPNGFSEPHFWNGSSSSSYTTFDLIGYQWKQLSPILPFLNYGHPVMANKTFGWLFNLSDPREVYQWDGDLTATLKLTIPVGDYWTAIKVNGVNSAWLGTNKGRVYHWDGVMWTLIFTHPMMREIEDFYITSNPLEEGSFFHSDIDLYKWDGATWNLDVTPFPLDTSIKISFSGFSDKNIWLCRDRSLFGIDIAHFDGLNWNLLTPIVDYPAGVVGNLYPSINFINATAEDDAWLIVNENKDLLRYNGTRWNYYKFNYPNKNDFNYRDIFSLSKNDVWFNVSVGVSPFTIAFTSVFRYDGEIFYRLQEKPFFSDIDKQIPGGGAFAGQDTFSRILYLSKDGGYFAEATSYPSYIRSFVRRESVPPIFYNRVYPYKGLPSIDGCVWDDDCYWDITIPYPNALLDIIRVIKKWKPATTSCRFIQVRIGDRWYSFPVHEDWELDKDGNSKEDFYNKTYLYVR